MRELKFRAWDQSQKYMAYQGEPDLETRTSFFFHFGKYILMQSTNFKDKHNKEIFEGDILGDWYDNDGKPELSKKQVFWCENAGAWKLDNSFNQNATRGDLLSDELLRFAYEITGNIYENAFQNKH